jgi:hypothetical protein
MLVDCMEKMYDYSMKNKRFSCGVCHDKGKAIYFLKGVLFRKSKARAFKFNICTCTSVYQTRKKQNISLWDLLKKPGRIL